jgi:hypothetical protein
MAQQAFTFETNVGPSGKVEVNLPLPPGTPVEVIVLSSEGEDDLLRAASTSTDFWDNPWDDEDWNNA